MTITGRQIREARALLGLQRNELAAKAKVVTIATIVRAESVEDASPITAYQADAICQALERADIEFTVDPTGIRLRTASPA